MIAKKQLLIICIFILGLALRLYQLGNLPKILNRDEAALAYNAVLLKESGKDEWQRTWPVAFESFGDYKLPGYILTLTTLFRFLPQEDWVVRLPAAVAGASLIPLAYWLAKSLKYKIRATFILATFISTTPVFFFYSRMAFEAVLGLALWVLVHILLFKPEPVFKKRVLIDAAALLIFVLAAFTYNTPFLLLPFLLLTIPFVRGVKNWRSWIGTIFAFILTGIVIGFLLIPLSNQKKGVTLFSDETTNTNSILYREALPPTLKPILGNKYTYFTFLLFKNFTLSFTPQFLVTHGGTHPWHTQPGFSHLNWTLYLLGLVGIFSSLGVIHQVTLSLLQFLSSSKKPRFSLTWTQSRKVLVLYLLVVSLAPSVVTVDSPHATRSLAFFFWWVVLAVEGVIELSSLLRPKLKNTSAKLAPVVMAVVVLLSLGEFTWYGYNYFLSYPNRQPAELKIGFDTAIQQLHSHYPDKAVAIVDGDGYHYILTAWYLHLPATEYFATNVRQQPNSIGFRYGEKVAHYHFIAHASDRTKTNETVLLDWINNQWQLETF